MIDIGTTEILLTLISGGIVGLFLALFGGGGSVLAAPLLLNLVGVLDAHIAIGTSAAAVSANAAVGLIGHWRKERVKWPCASVFAVAGVIGSLAGSTLAKSIEGDLLLFAFSIAMALIALSMLRKPKSEGNMNVRINAEFISKLVPIGLLAGFAAGFFGIGGGFLIIPGLMLATGMTITNAAASSLLSVTVFGAATAGN
ncbi:MAG: sulfite exporter TauE/SafE family protein, partial [Proteobacteria bacterium]|nr:sulfite exporter TauE/SafE family protein [Pseudomonadota bacterium]